MAPSPSAIKSLKQSKEALVQIRKQLLPFAERLGSSNLTEKAQAQAVVALAVGTLRYMGARLQGKDEGRKVDDPLRQELNQMRKVLMQVEKKRKYEEGRRKKKDGDNSVEETKSDKQSTPDELTPTKKKRRKK